MISDYLILVGETMEEEYPCLTSQQWMDLVVQGPQSISAKILEICEDIITNDINEAICTRRLNYVKQRDTIQQAKEILKIEEV